MKINGKVLGDFLKKSTVNGTVNEGKFNFKEN